MQTIYAFSYNPTVATGTNTTKTVWRMAYQQPILLYKGTANTIKLVIFNNSQKVVDLSDYDVQVQIVDKDTQEHFVTRTAVIDAPANGIAQVTFTEADLRNLQHRFYHIIARLMPPGDGSTVVAGEILYLDDNYGAFTPVTIEDAWNFQPTNISVTDGASSITFTGIGETPDSFAGLAGAYLRVNTAEDSLEFTTVTSDINLLAVSTDIRPASDNTLSLGNATNRWNSLRVGNIAISASNISTAATGANSLAFTANRHTLSLTDTSVGNTGIGAVLRIDDISGSPGPRFETWYGNASVPTDPPGQHSLDIYAGDINSYVEFASYDDNTYMGVDSQGAFIYTNYQIDKTHSWYFSADGDFRVPNDGKISNNNGNAAILFNANNITIVTNDPDGSTIHTSSFEENGDLFLDGNLIPNSNVMHSLGSPTNQWKDLYVSNTTIYLGGVPLSVDAGGNLLVNGNTVTGGGAANTGNFSFENNNLYSSSAGEIVIGNGRWSQEESTAQIRIPSQGGGSDDIYIQNTTGGGIQLAGGSGSLSIASTGQVNFGVSAIDGYSSSAWLTAGNDIRLSANGTGIWKFGTDGNLTLPANGDILDSNGVSVLGGNGTANLGNLDIVGNTISTTNTNGDITLDPNGTGYVNINSSTLKFTAGQPNHSR